MRSETVSPFLDKRLESCIIGLMCPCNGYGKTLSGRLLHPFFLTFLFVKRRRKQEVVRCCYCRVVRVLAAVLGVEAGRL